MRYTTFNHLTPNEGSEKLDNLRASLINVREATEDLLRGGCPDTVETDAANPEWLAKMMCVVGASYGIPRAPLDRTWEGPGVYRIRVESGLSQDTSWRKLDDMLVVAKRIGDLSY